MESSQGSTLTSAAANVGVCVLNWVPVYVKELIAGGAAGAFSKTAVAPLERVKILLQGVLAIYSFIDLLQFKLSKYGTLYLERFAGTDQPNFRTQEFKSLGVYHSLRRLKQTEGFIGFYKGNGASVLRIAPYAALHYMTYERYRCFLLNNYSNYLGTGPFVDLLAGSASGGTAVLCTYPLDLARTKLAYQVSGPTQGEKNIIRRVSATPAYSGIRDVFKQVYLEGGFRALYRGVGPTLMGILPYAGLKFYIYEELKTRVPDDYKNSVTLRLACGALAGLFGQTLTYPLDVVRRQMQVQSRRMTDQVDGPRITGTFQGLTAIARSHGWRQLFAGLSLNYIKVVPSVAIGFTSYDMMKNLMGVPPREKTNSSSASSTS